MSIEANKAVLWQLVQELEQGNLSVLDQHPGLNEVRPMLTELLAAQGAGVIQQRIEEVIAEGDWVACRIIRTGGPFGAGVEELAMFKVVDGTIVKQHSQGGPL
jgi:predicted SnoaL-like aldol condensation-catalyzing enzyme